MGWNALIGRNLSLGSRQSQIRTVGQIVYGSKPMVAKLTSVKDSPVWGRFPSLKRFWSGRRFALHLGNVVVGGLNDCFIFNHMASPCDWAPLQRDDLFCEG